MKDIKFLSLLYLLCMSLNILAHENNANQNARLTLKEYVSIFVKTSKLTLLNICKVSILIRSEKIILDSSQNVNQESKNITEGDGRK